MFEIGSIYKRSELHAKWGGQRQGGIATPINHPFVLLFTGIEGQQYGYKDGWNDDGEFLYTGEGQIGDMQFVKGNKAILRHSQDGKDLFLFEKAKTGFVRFIGLFSCCSWEYREANDKTGKPRKVIVFHLLPITDESKMGSDLLLSDSIETPRSASPSLESLRKRAFEMAEESPPGMAKIGKRRYYERSNTVRLYVLMRANGVCESCQKPAPFKRMDEEPYLEPHHTRRLSDFGPDHPRWIGAICPNCHRQIHYGIDGQELNKKLQQFLDERETKL